MTVRRWFAARKRKRVADVWPILPGSERPPPGWPGWPDGKQFAFVLTHDVESPAGLERVKPLAELEMNLGFRSCFSFVPEGNYSVPLALRTWLTDHGFEVGVHDLHHDGSLYRSRAAFRWDAQRINCYLKDWEAVGFRSAFLFHRLDWLHDLDIAYDSSTFDTDPFEPQPDDVGTIFPFWVLTPSVKSEEQSADACRLPLSPLRSGYVELPYTLPQDSTLFQLLREPSIRLWQQKLDWIAQHGGMALVNVHPDYLRFEGDPPSSRTVAAAFYARFLEYARQKHGQTFWHPLPKELARFVLSVSGAPSSREAPSPTTQPAPGAPSSARPTMEASLAGVAGAPPSSIGKELTPPRRPLRVCMLTHSFYESDSRVIRYAEALAARGDAVDVLALKRSADAPRAETIAGVHVFRLQSRPNRRERSPLPYLVPLLKFTLRSSAWITRRHARQHYDLVHVHNVPDFLAFAAWYPKLTGAPIILDIHDIVPEFFMSKFNARPDSLIIKGLLWKERWSAAFADHVIMANHLWLDRYVARSAPPHKCSVFINCVDMRVFHPRPRTRNDGKTVILFPGGLQWHQGLDIAIRAFARVNGRLPQAEFQIYGDGNTKPGLMALVKDLGLDGCVRFFDPLPLVEIAEVMANADLGVVPKRADSFGNEAYSTKIMEFMSLGVPVVASSTRIDRYYFDDTVVRFFESGNPDDMASAMLDVLQNPDLRRDMVGRALDYARRDNWEGPKHDYLRLVDHLCQRKTESGPSGR
jgi:glycosyltransferase involved in cell wall biosynthesis